MLRSFHIFFPVMAVFLLLISGMGFALGAEQGDDPDGPLTESQRLTEIIHLLNEAEAALAADRLTIPAGRNAHEAYLRILALDPGNLAAQGGLERIVRRYVDLALEALGRGNQDEARALLRRGEGVVPDFHALAVVRERLEDLVVVDGPGTADSDDDVSVVQDGRGLITDVTDENADQTGWLTVTQEQGGQADRHANEPFRPGDVWTDPDTGMEFVWVPEGCFQMGCGPWAEPCRVNETPAHEVCLSGFWMGQYEVTQAQWMLVMGDNPSRFQGADNPVDGVSWYMAQEFIQRLNSRGGISGFRLPSEAQWEYACRGGGSEEGYCGGDDVHSLAWHAGNSGARPHPVGQMSPNALGLYDMSGNVAEWCEDVYDVRTYSRPGPVQDPVHDPVTLRGEDADRVFRGGSWATPTWGTRSAFRGRNTPGLSYSAVGLRLVKLP